MPLEELVGALVVRDLLGLGVELESSAQSLGNATKGEYLCKRP